MKRVPRAKKRKKISGGIDSPQERYLFMAGSILLIIVHFFLWISDGVEVNTNLSSRPTLLKSWTSILELMAIGSVIYLLFTWLRRGTPNKYLVALSMVAMVAYYLSSFNVRLAPNGDNAEYITTAKSLTERGAAIRLDVPAELKNPLSSIGLPLLLSPIYRVWGRDFIKMKSAILLLALLLGLLLYALLRFYATKNLALLLALLTFSSPYLVGTSSSIMTETPYLFWSALALWLAHKYVEAKRHVLWWLLALLVATGMSYLTRAIGISVGLAILIYLVMTALSARKRTVMPPIFWDPWKKLSVFATPFLLAAIWWQMRQGISGTSHLNMFLDGDIFHQFSQNVFALANVWGKMLFSGETFRWYRLATDHTLTHLHAFWMIPPLVVMIGLIAGLLKRHLMSLYTLAALGLILMGSATPQERVLIRYTSVLLPFFLYYLYFGANWLVNTLKKRWDNEYFSRLSQVFIACLILQLFLVHFSSNRYNVLVKSPVYNSYYDSFLRAAEWCGDNLPAESIIMSVKPRLVYVLSDLKGVTMAKERDSYSDEWVDEMLKKIKTNKVTHLIVDAISLTTKENIYPLLENHPQYFQAVPVPNLNNQCTVVKVK